MPGPFPLESPGFQWLIMCQLLPGLKHHNSRRSAQAKPTFCSVLPSMAPQWGLQGRQCQEKGTDTHSGPKVMAAGRFQGDSITRSSQTMIKSRQRWNFYFFLVLKWLSFNKDTRNKHISISPLKVVSFSSSFLPKASSRQLASQEQHKIILLERATPKHSFKSLPR